MSKSNLLLNAVVKVQRKINKSEETIEEEKKKKEEKKRKEKKRKEKNLSPGMCLSFVNLWRNPWSNYIEII